LHHNQEINRIDVMTIWCCF